LLAHVIRTRLARGVCRTGDCWKLDCRVDVPTRAACAGGHIPVRYFESKSRRSVSALNDGLTQLTLHASAWCYHRLL